LNRIKHGGGAAQVPDLQLQFNGVMGAAENRPFIYLPIAKLQQRLDESSVCCISLPADWIQQLMADCRDAALLLKPSSYKSNGSRGCRLMHLPTEVYTELEPAAFSAAIYPAVESVELIELGAQARVAASFEMLEEVRLGKRKDLAADGTPAASLQGVGVSELTAAAHAQLHQHAGEALEPQSLFKAYSDRSSPLCMDYFALNHAAAGLSRSVDLSAVHSLFRSRIHLTGCGNDAKQADIGACPLRLQPAGLPAVHYQASGVTLLIEVRPASDRHTKLEKLAATMMQHEHDFDKSWLDQGAPLFAKTMTMSMALFYAGALMPSLSQLDEAGIKWTPKLIPAGRAVVLNTGTVTMSLTASASPSTAIAANQFDQRYFKDDKGLRCVTAFFDWLTRLKTHMPTIMQMRCSRQFLPVPLEVLKRAVEFAPQPIVKQLCCQDNERPCILPRDEEAATMLRGLAQLQQELLDLIQQCAQDEQLDAQQEQREQQEQQPQQQPQEQQPQLQQPQLQQPQQQQIASPTEQQQLVEQKEDMVDLTTDVDMQQV
jgi:hypothetical protein